MHVANDKIGSYPGNAASRLPGALHRRDKWHRIESAAQFLPYGTDLILLVLMRREAERASHAPVSCRKGKAQ